MGTQGLCAPVPVALTRRGRGLSSFKYLKLQVTSPAFDHAILTWQGAPKFMDVLCFLLLSIQRCWIKQELGNILERNESIRQAFGGSQSCRDESFSSSLYFLLLFVYSSGSNA